MFKAKELVTQNIVKGYFVRYQNRDVIVDEENRLHLVDYHTLRQGTHIRDIYGVEMYAGDLIHLISDDEEMKEDPTDYIILDNGFNFTLNDIKDKLAARFIFGDSISHKYLYKIIRPLSV